MLKNILETECSDKELLKKALIHPSFSKENNLDCTNNYERLEFLGDAVLKLIISKLLYLKYPDYREGNLTKIRSILVSDMTLADIAEKINLPSKIIMGKGEDKTGGRKKQSNLACALEAILGAYYLDNKFNEIEDFIETNLLPLAESIDKHFELYNAKAILQEYTQKMSSELPEYILDKTTGPEHNKIFTVSVKYKDTILASGTGKTKKEAEQNCAFKACIKLNIIKED